LLNEIGVYARHGGFKRRLGEVGQGRDDFGEIGRSAHIARGYHKHHFLAQLPQRAVQCCSVGNELGHTRVHARCSPRGIELDAPREVRIRSEQAAHVTAETAGVRDDIEHIVAGWGSRRVIRVHAMLGGLGLQLLNRCFDYRIF
jgi:hypothetical protein